MKVLSIGNSFSQDSHNMLHTLAISNGTAVETVNLYIGGCRLQKHWENIQNNSASYDLERNGGTCERKISIEEALGMENWDIITLQQLSAQSQDYSTYTPYLTDIADYVKEKCPDAQLRFHQTWAYENDYFADCSRGDDTKQKSMYKNILAASAKASEAISAPLIKTNVAVQAVRENVAEFDYKNGGMSLCRDGAHLSYDYGRFVAAYTWLYELTGIWGDNIPFRNLDKGLCQKIAEAVKEALK